MDANALKVLFEINHYAIGVNVRDLSHEQSLLEPEPGGNCANWVLGHILQNRGSILELVGELPVWSEAEGAAYKRGSKPIGSGGPAKPFPELLEALDRSQERLLKGLSRLAADSLGSAEEEGSLGRKLAFLQFHEAYHAGQLGLLRRIAGKPGAIR